MSNVIYTETLTALFQIPLHFECSDKYNVTNTLLNISMTGDLMGPTVNGLDKLLRMPYGCGEQTMLGFAPDIFVTNYLAATHQLTSDIEEKAVGFMEKGNLTIYNEHLLFPIFCLAHRHQTYFWQCILCAKRSENGDRKILLCQYIQIVSPTKIFSHQNCLKLY